MPDKPRVFRIGKPPRRAPHARKTDERGYGRDWQKLARWHLQQFPLCKACEEEGLTVPGKHVDHIVPFNGKDDVLRLEPSNLQTLCLVHHAQKHHGKKQ